MASVRIALAQPFQSDAKDSPTKPPAPVADNLERIVRCVKQAGEMKADIVCFPETALSGSSHDVPPDSHREIANAVRETGIWCIYGSYVRDGETVHNEAIVLKSDGVAAAKIKKAHLWHEDGVSAGNEMPRVIETPFGGIGVIICWDIAFPDRARFLAVKGADIIFCPAFWYGYGHGFDTANLLLSIAQTRAFENQTFLVLVDAQNPETTGLALVAGPDGKLLPSRYSHQDERDVNSVDIDTGALAASRAIFDCGPLAAQ